MLRTPARGLWAAAALMMASCRHEIGSSGTASLVVKRDTIGDTIVVRNVKGAAWGDSLAVIEEMRIGKEDGGEEYLFGHVSLLAIDRAHDVYAYDDRSNILRVYDSAGKYLRSQGRSGAGPGEYIVARGMAFLPNGNLALADPANARVNIYLPSGAIDQTWPMSANYFAGDMIHVDTAGRVYLPFPVRSTEGRPDMWEPVTVGYERRSASGKILDTIIGASWLRIRDRAAWYGAETYQALHPYGGFVIGNSGDYRIEVKTDGGRVVRIERENQIPIPTSAGERKSMSQIIDETARDPHWAGGKLSVPETKPFFKALKAGEDGRVWAQVWGQSAPAPGTTDTTLIWQRWVEPNQWDLFEPDGTYLGRVQLPDRADPIVMRGDLVWGLLENENGVESVVRWRIRH